MVQVYQKKFNQDANRAFLSSGINIENGVINLWFCGFNDKLDQYTIENIQRMMALKDVPGVEQVFESFK